MSQGPKDIDGLVTLLRVQDYVCGRDLATVAFLGLRLGKPLFLEGEAGTGKTEIAKSIAAGLGRELIRLQCYEGLDAAQALPSGTLPRRWWRSGRQKRRVGRTKTR